MEVTESQSQQGPPDLSLGAVEPPNIVQQCHASEGTASPLATPWVSVDATQTVTQLTKPTAIFDLSFSVPILGSLAAAVLFVLGLYLLILYVQTDLVPQFSPWHEKRSLPLKAMLSC
jgi:hypothetical protein